MYRRGVAIREIERLGGEVEIEPVGPVSVARWIARHHLIGLGRVCGVWLTGDQFDDEAPGLLRSFGELDELVIDSPNMTDAVLQRLSSMHATRHLSVSGPKLTNGGLARLASLHGLRSLWVAGDNFTDDAMPALRQLTALEHLWVESGEVTSTGLELLAPLTNLAELELVATRVTQRDIDRFRSRHPEMQVKRSGSGGNGGLKIVASPIRFVFQGEIIIDDPSP